ALAGGRRSLGAHQGRTCDARAGLPQRDRQLVDEVLLRAGARRPEPLALERLASRDRDARDRRRALVGGAARRRAPSGVVTTGAGRARLATLAILAALAAAAGIRHAPGV